MNLQRVLPTWFEAIGLFVLTVLFVLVGNTKELLSYYGLSSTDKVITQSTGDAISIGLSKIDTFSFTDRVVTFLVWALIGVLCFTIVQAIARVYQEVKEEEQVSSNRYVHPRAFTRASFWRQIVIDFVVTVLGLALLVFGLFLLFGYVLPIALKYTQTFLTGLSLPHFGQFIIGLFMIYGWAIILVIILKFILNRHRLTTR